MDYEKLLNLFKNEETTRIFKKKEIKKEDLTKILKAGRFAPSGVNSQPWQIILIDKIEKKKQIAKIISESQESLKDSFPYKEKQKVLKRYINPGYQLIVCGDKRLKETYPIKGYRDEILATSVYGIIYYMRLAAEALDLALSWGTLNKLSRKNLKDYLDLPSYLRPYEVLQLGYPQEKQKQSKNRKEIKEFIHFNDYNEKITDDRLEEFLNKRESYDIYQE